MRKMLLLMVLVVLGAGCPRIAYLPSECDDMGECGGSPDLALSECWNVFKTCSPIRKDVSEDIRVCETLVVEATNKMRFDELARCVWALCGTNKFDPCNPDGFNEVSCGACRYEASRFGGGCERLGKNCRNE